VASLQEGIFFPFKSVSSQLRAGKKGKGSIGIWSERKISGSREKGGRRTILKPKSVKSHVGAVKGDRPSYAREARRSQEEEKRFEHWGVKRVVATEKRSVFSLGFFGSRQGGGGL